MNHVFDDELDSSVDNQPPLPRTPRRRRMLIASIAVSALILGGGGTAYTFARQSEEAAAEERPTIRTSTAKIEQGTLAGSRQSPGTLDFADKRTIAAGSGGTLTATAPIGSQVALGNGLYWVDNTPVLLLHGPLPAWRAFGLGMGNGPDVMQLEMSLAALGYFDRTPDLEFAESTERAIKRWQKALGLEQTGRLELGSVIFMAGDVRVGSVDAALGSQIGQGGNVLTVTSLGKRVQVDLKTADQRLAVVGATVTISLPGGTTTSGTVSVVGAPVEKESNGQSSVSIPVTIDLDDLAVVADLQRATVTVGFPSERREDVLSVPVEALTALDSERFGVEVVNADGTTKRIPVTTGLFADGRVEISGGGVTAGVDVVVPAA
ncbi:Multidrug efflux pump subunit AcrA (membrane-fusion protein) [Plantibacter flavus]|uniref:Multidrug efflux pump subunit AcrA (Membrane-fusion protein) n=1 Tax=Plantibacter flavus TaxID=150123 RepID=A0A3N2BXM5_9MICO|nr:peptidoglycan-binding protein [Plantibacter flavus]ROR80023.1 multidrug efflux pump subunit AcrA (membrane-fusion protein) [Plantibacter flavus]SMG28693.1 Multidrug efflux pump subunit AcrA (membrane-fusion protein) [Plantibacter flavus]